MSWLSEIKKVGLVDWLWFVIVLSRNPASHKLNFLRYYPNLDRLTHDRIRAMEIEKTLSPHPLYDRRAPSGIVDKSTMTNRATQ